jgi:hypothetical protein
MLIERRPMVRLAAAFRVASSGQQRLDDLVAQDEQGRQGAKARGSRLIAARGADRQISPLARNFFRS